MSFYKTFMMKCFFLVIFKKKSVTETVNVKPSFYILQRLLYQRAYIRK